MDTIYWRMNATQGGANCAYEHGFRVDFSAIDVLF